MATDKNGVRLNVDNLADVEAINLVPVQVIPDPRDAPYKLDAPILFVYTGPETRKFQCRILAIDEEDDNYVHVMMSGNPDPSTKIHGKFLTKTGGI